MADFAADLIAGLLRPSKAVSSKYLYDARGSALFEAITRLPEYDLTRNELALLENYGTELAERIGPHAQLIEFGSGSAMKTRALLEALDAPVSYRPIEISPAALAVAANDVSSAFPQLTVAPLQADFSRLLPTLDLIPGSQRNLLYFSGSTIGNFEVEDARHLVARIGRIVGPGGALLMGLDLVKPAVDIEAAYNDRHNLTAAFSLNLWLRANRELGADFDLSRFSHRARYVRTRSRIETDLISSEAQTVRLNGVSIDFAKDEAVRIEISTKYTQADAIALGQAGGFELESWLTDRQQRFALALYTRRPV